MKLQIIIGLIVAFCTSTCFARSAPANDDCVNATEIYLGLTPFSNIDATTDGQPEGTCQFDGQTYDDIWYTFTVGSDGTLVVSTCNLVDYDSDIVVYLGDDCGSLTLLGCNDDGAECSEFSSYLEVQVYLGDRLTIRVGSYGDSTSPGSGSLLLDIIDHDGNSVTSPSNDNCINAAVIAEGDTYFTTVDATTDGPNHPSCETANDGGATGNDIWYKYTPSSSGMLTLSTCDQAYYDTDVVIYDNTDCNALSLLGCNDDGDGCNYWSSHLEVAITGGVEYLIRVGGFQTGHTGTGLLSLTIETNPIWIGEDGGSWFDASNWSSGTVPSNSDMVTINGSAIINQLGATAASITIQNGGHLQIGTGSSNTGSLNCPNITVESGGILQLQNSSSSITSSDITIQTGGGLNWFGGTIEIFGGILSSTSDITMGLYDTCVLSADLTAIYAKTFTIGTLGSMEGTSWSYVDLLVNYGSIVTGGSYSYTKIYGDYIQSSSGTLVTHLTSDASYTWLIVANNPSISGSGVSTIEGTVRLVSNGGYSPADNTTFDALKSYESLHSGTFDSIETIGFTGGVTFTQSESANGVTVTSNVVPIHYVDADNTSGDGSSWVNAYPTVQDALAAASMGDQIWVAEGTYTPGTMRSDTFSTISNVTIYGGFNGTETSVDQRDVESHPSILSGDIGIPDDASDNVYHVVTCSGIISSLDGMSVTGGNANGTGELSKGGGIYQSYQSVGRLTLRNCSIIENRSNDKGGGIYADVLEAEFNNCTIVNNTSVEGGGACLLNATSFIEQTSFIDNSAYSYSMGMDPQNADGGGLYVQGGALSITDSNFHNNYALWSSGLSRHGTGGAIYAYCNIDIGNTTFTENRSLKGGAIYFCDVSGNVVLIHHSTFERNYIMAHFGLNPIGAAAIEQVGNSNTEIVNCLFASNYGSGEPIVDVGTYGTLGNRITNCTIAHNTGLENSGAFEGEAKLENCIFWYNEGTSGRHWSNQINPTETSTASKCLIDGWNANGGNIIISQDPLFVSPRGPDGVYGTGDEDYHLLPGSPIIDWGNDGFWDYPAESVPQVDLDGNSRFVDDPYTADANAPSTIDLGCYEYQIQTIGEPGFRLWVGNNLFQTDSNWEPADAPSTNDTVVILNSFDTISFSENASIDRAIYGSGIADFELNSNTLSIGSENNSLCIGHLEDMSYSVCELGILNGTVIAGQVDISGVGNGAIYFDNSTIQAPNGFIIRDDGEIYGQGTIQGNVYNGGSHLLDSVNYSFPSVTGDYFMTENSIAGLVGSGEIVYYLHDYSGTETLSSISVGGETTLGGVLQLHGNNNTLNTGESATILSSDGGITDNFDSILAMGFGPDELPIVSIVANADVGESVIVTMQSISGILDFDTPDPTNIYGLPKDVELGDIDGDGFIDIVMSVPDTNDDVSDTDDVIIIYNGGTTNGSWNGFTGGTNQIFVGNSPGGLTVGDFDDDGDVDIAVVNTLDDTVSLCENETNARSIVSFTVTHVQTDYYAADPATLIARPTDVTHASFSGTSDIDLAIANSGDGKMVIIEGPLFDLAFRPISGSAHQTTGGATTIDPGDVNNDKGFTITVTGDGGKSNVFKGRTELVTEWDPPIVLNMGSSVSEQLVEDLDQNGKDDLIVCDNSANTISIALQKTDETYGTPAMLELDAPLNGWYESPVSLSVIDIDDDNDLDLAVVATNESGDIVTVLFRNDSPLGGELAIFTDIGHEEGSGLNPLKARSADVDNDGYDDLLMITNTIAFRSNTAVGSTQTVVNSYIPPPCPGDLNDDGTINVADLLIIMESWGPGNGDGDINGDGNVNVADLLILMSAWGVCP